MTEPEAKADPSALLWPALLLVVSALGWGMLYSLNRLATTDGIPFVPYVFWMGVGGGPVAARVRCRLSHRYPSSPGRMCAATSHSAPSPSA